MTDRNYQTDGERTGPGQDPSRPGPQGYSPQRDFYLGHDHPEIVDPPLSDLPVTLANLPRLLLLLPIRLYQKTLSRTLPPNTCRFYPTCSHFGYQAIYKYGALKGGAMAAWRVLRCNPLNPGGYDPLP